MAIFEIHYILKTQITFLFNIRNLGYCKPLKELVTPRQLVKYNLRNRDKLAITRFNKQVGRSIQFFIQGPQNV